jgi:outer membrane usher protein
MYLPSVALALVVLAAHATPLRADPDEAEHARVFQRSRPATRAPVLLRLDGVEIAGDAPLLLELGPDPRLAAAPVLAALEPRLRDEARTALRAAVRQHRLTLRALRAIGLVAIYDPQRLEVRIEIPAPLTRTASHDLGTGAPPEAAGALAPSAVSGHVNLRAGGGTRWTDAVSSTERYLHADSAVNVRGWVLEARASVTSASPVFHRGDVLLSRDLSRHAVRLLAGDHAVPATGLQASYPVLGLAVTRNYALQPYRVVRPIGTFDFVLDRASKVVVLVNRMPVQTLTLAAGRHDLRDLPLGAGVSDVELLITDPNGAERRIAFSAGNPDALLAPGIVQFSVGVGFPLVSDLGLRDYDLTRPILAARRRWGVTPLLTIGGSLDGDPDRQVGAGELGVATVRGNFAIDLATSHARGVGTGFAAGVRWDYIRTVDHRLRTLTLSGHHHSPEFRNFGLVTAEPYRTDLALSASRRLSAPVTARLTARYQLAREAPDGQDIALGIMRSVGAFSIDTTASFRRGLAEEARLFVTAHWTLPGRAGMVHGASRASSVAGISNEATFSKRAALPPGVGASVTVNETPTHVGAGGALDYTGYRFTSSLATTTQMSNEGAITQTASFEAATALVFAGGRAAWSRPITGSFAIVERHPALAGIALGVNPALGGYAARTDSFGLAVVPNLEPYRVGSLVVEAPELPTGYSLGPPSHTLLPTYRSGTLVRVGEDSTVFARGTLEHRGEPLAYAVAELVDVADAKRAPIVVMANRAGRFNAMGMRPGRYRVVVAGEPVLVGELVVPRHTTGLFLAGLVPVR